MKAGSARRVAARRSLVAAAIAASALAGCGGESNGTTASQENGAVRGVAAHRLADAPARGGLGEPAPTGRGSARPNWRGPHPVKARSLTVGRDGLYARWYAPTDVHRPTPAVVTIGGSNGGLRTGPLARAFASYGYPALALAYFKAPGLPKQLANIPLEYFRRAIEFVRHQRGVDRVVLMGSSRGGEAALLIGSTYPRLVQGVVAIVPHYQVNYGWSLHGKPVPYDTVIPVERIRGPILTASGGRDQVWSSSVYTEQIQLRLRDKHFRYAHKRLNFPKEGHNLAGVQAELWAQIRAFMRRLAAAHRDPARGS